VTAAERASRTESADKLCASSYDGAGGPPVGAALVAVGGYGRGELAPHSDLDLVLVHDASVAPGDLAERLWYPLWDSGAKVDHSVRSLPEMVTAAAADPRVALGLLDVRHLAGDPHLTLRLRTTMLAEWRRDARDRLPGLADLTSSRHEIVGELAHASVPDLKEAEGGLRDATVLKALVATWLVDVPHRELERSRLALLDVRDVLHGVLGRASDRVAPEAWEDLASGVGLPDGAAAQTHVREHGRRITHLSRLTWRRVEAVLARPSRDRRPDLAALGGGVALSNEEVVLDRGARPDRDPLLLLRCAAEASERDVVLAPATAARLAREGVALPEPWPTEARQLFVRLLAGRGLLETWSTLEETGSLDRLLPEWERIRLLPHASVIHRFTVDRHVIETCLEAAALIREVSRPDVLLVAALLHDIGKGGLVSHSVAGEPLARDVARRMGFDDAAVDRIGRLVRWHLLLGETATSRDPEDPATTAMVAERVGDAETLELLLALTQADALAASAKAWSSWRAGLVRRLAAAVAAELGDAPLPARLEGEVDVPASVLADHAAVEIAVEPDDDGSVVTVISGDRVGLLADVAAVLAWQRASVRGARAWAQGDVACSVWHVADAALDPAVLRTRFEGVVSGRLDPEGRLAPTGTVPLAPTVVVHPEASAQATVLEVRAADRAGVLWQVLSTLARLGISVRSAHVDTLGPQATDVFYLQEPGAGALAETRAATAAHAVRAAVTP